MLDPEADEARSLLLGKVVEGQRTLMKIQPRDVAGDRRDLAERLHVLLPKVSRQRLVVPEARDHIAQKNAPFASQLLIVHEPVILILAEMK